MTRIFAYCDVRYVTATRKAAGGEASVFACPPQLGGMTLDAFAHRIEQSDLVLFNLHADPNIGYWFSSNGEAALTQAHLARCNLRAAVVFMINCHAGGSMLDALKAARPRAIIGGQGENFGAQTLLAGADTLALWFRRGVQLGLNHRSALRLAQTRLRLGAQTRSVKDALRFEVLYEMSNLR